MAEINEDNFCYFPFMQMLLQPTGVISPCCWNQDVVYGVVPDLQLSEIWNGEVAQGLRREFLEGTPKTCAKHMRHIGCHKNSLRDFKNEIELSVVQTSGPKRLDVRLNGHCNLQCVMCDVWKQPNGLYSKSDFWKTGPTEIFPFLSEIDVLGGEPFIQADTYRLIDEISSVNPNCFWSFVTNGNYKFSETIRKRLDKIRIRWIQISIDGLRPETYASVRIKGELSKALKTVEDLLQYQAKRASQGTGFIMISSFCVTKLNWQDIPLFLDYSYEKKLTPILQFAYIPSNFSLLTSSQKELQKIYRFLEDLNTKYGTHPIAPIFLPVKETLEGNSKSGDSRSAFARVEDLT